MKKYIPYAVVAAVFLAVGYFATPTKTVTEFRVKEVIKEVEKKVSDKEKNKRNNKMVIIVETIMPDGTRRKETKIVDKGTITVTANETTDTTVEKEVETVETKTVERDKTGLLIYGIAGANLNELGELEYGLGVQSRLFGPFWLGAYATTQKNVALTLGLSF